MTLIGFEESQIITIALRQIGIEAYSCDLKKPSGNHPEWHIQQDIFQIINLPWEKIILHPPCTYTALSGNRWYAQTSKREEAAQFTKKIWEISTSKCNFVALEQPKTIMQNYLGKRTQVIHPWQHGHPEVKPTWLWLKGFPQLKPTNIVTGREEKIWQMTKSKQRQEIRSKTYPGIANAIAQQWFTNL